MNLRGRVTLIISICFLLLVGMLLLEGRSREAVVENRLERTQLLGLEVSWNGVVEAERQRLLGHLETFLRNPDATSAFVVSDEEGLAQATIAIRSDLRTLTFQALSPDGTPFFATEAAGLEAFLTTDMVSQVLTATDPVSGLTLSQDGTLNFVVAAPVFSRTGVAGIAAIRSSGDALVRELGNLISVPVVLMRADGQLLNIGDQTNDDVLTRLTDMRFFGTQLATVQMDDLILRAVSVQLPGPFLPMPVSLVAIQDVREEVQRRNLFSWISYFALASTVVLFLAFINWSLRTSFRPLNTVIQSLNALSEGRTEIQVTVPARNRHDEIGRLAGTFESFRQGMEARVSLDRIQQELDVATRIQTQCLPGRFPEQTNMRFSANMRPMREVGGDFYDVFRLPDKRIACVIADVSDKGMGAALFMAISRTVVRSTAMVTPDPAVCIRRVNEYLCEDNEAMLFVTLFYAIIDPKTGQMEYCNAGHNPPVLMLADQTLELITTDVQPALGIWEDYEYEGASLVLSDDSRLFLYTDGVTEAMTSDGEEFGEERLIDSLAQVPGGDVETLIETVTGDVDDFVAGASQSDDITCMAVAYRDA